MNDIEFFLKKIDHESGVMVAVKHLCHHLQEAGIRSAVHFYRDDEDLIRLVSQTNCRCVNLHVPSFSDETLSQILQIHDNVVLSIHSTICNLQTEGEALARLLRLANSGYRNLRFTCPSLSECKGLNEVCDGTFQFLPNTFSYPVSEEAVMKSIEERTERLGNDKHISLFCEYRPLKNMLSQVAAVIGYNRTCGQHSTLHILESSQHLPIYENLLRMCEYGSLDLSIQKRLPNEDFFPTEGQMHIGMQASLSETYSYVAFEHMIQGVPVIGSDAVPFSSLIVPFSHIGKMQRALEDILNPKRYASFCSEARRKAIDINQYNVEKATRTIYRLCG